jgi:hypothetical protein
MKIDWKNVCESPGYKSLKAVYVKAVQDAAKQIKKGRTPMRNKEEFLRHFNWIIGRAKHYADHANCTLDIVLNAWEEKRTYCWLNFYQDGRQPKFHLHNRYNSGVKGSKNYFKKSKRYPRGTRKSLVCSEIKKEQAKASTKSPARWSKRQKIQRRLYNL